VQSNPPLMPYRRACDGRYTAISRFCSTDRRRRLSPRVITVNLLPTITGQPPTVTVA